MKAQEQTSDAELIRAYQDGRPAAFDRLLERYQAPLFTFILRWVGDKPTAQDLFQETFLRIIRGLPNYREQGKFSGWLFGIAHRLCIDHHRRIKSADQLFEAFSLGEDHDGFADQAPSPLDELERSELTAIIEAAVQHMPATLKEVFLLRRHSDLSFREIAALVQRPLNTVLGQERQAILYLYDKVGKQYV
jgi:RNA polymerase sigma-70 factor, ECF subfamily